MHRGKLDNTPEVIRFAEARPDDEIAVAGHDTASAFVAAPLG